MLWSQRLIRVSPIFSSPTVFQNHLYVSFWYGDPSGFIPPRLDDDVELAETDSVLLGEKEEEGQEDEDGGDEGDGESDPLLEVVRHISYILKRRQELYVFIICTHGRRDYAEQVKAHPSRNDRPWARRAPRR
jgi:hypothetical protein